MPALPPVSATRPVVLAHERVIEVAGPLGALLPGGGLRRGGVVLVEGPTGAGSTSVALALVAAVTRVGEWAGALDLDGSLGPLAAAEAGAVLERLVVVRHVPPMHWASAVALLLDGVSVVLAEVPRYARPADARRLVARARERGTVLVPLAAPGSPWPAEAALRLHAGGGVWRGLGMSDGFLEARDSLVHVEGRGAPRPAGVDLLTGTG